MKRFRKMFSKIEKQKNNIIVEKKRLTIMPKPPNMEEEVYQQLGYAIEEILQIEKIQIDLTDPKTIEKIKEKHGADKRVRQPSVDKR